MDKKQSNLCKINEAEKNNEDDGSPKNKQRTRGKKRRRVSSDSSSDIEDVLPENTLEIEKNLHASALKNNLDSASVKKILKKVVTNDHVLALVKLREEEENSSTDETKQLPKLTRAKVKELKKVSTGSTPWNLENLELTPIKHIPVKTRPEVKALIAQELPEDEDDEEYEPTHEDVPSDDDQTLESCSDLDSQPRTPITPKPTRSSPKIVKDGPFKVPQEVTTPAKRKLDLDKEEATIALRTRSKLSLSETPIEHIESSFVPPDDLPVLAVDDLWNEFLVECLNPAPTSKHEDDDETDPEYNVAADPDAHEEDEEALEKTIIKISKKELNDLVTELFSIMPEVSGEECLDEDMPNDSLATPVRIQETEVSGHWEGKQEPNSDDENTPRKRLSDRIVFERRNSITRFSIGKSEPEDVPEYQENSEQTETIASTSTASTTIASTTIAGATTASFTIATAATASIATADETATTACPVVLENMVVSPQTILIRPVNVVNIALEEKVVYAEAPPSVEQPPHLLQQLNMMKKKEQQETRRRVEVHVTEGPCVLPEQLLILQQQIRQHIQLATSNFLQLFVHPVHWPLAPTYKGYLENFTKIVNERPNSAVGVCNLKPAMDLVLCWERSLSKDTPENAEYVQYIQKESNKGRRCSANNNFYVGSFHNTFMQVVSNSTAFLYPYLLPPVPFRMDTTRRSSYMRSEDELITLGLDQFWTYVENNPKLFPPPAKPHPRHRWGLNATVEEMTKYMFPFLNWTMLQTHIQLIRRRDKENPITKFVTTREVKPVQHTILPFNPEMTLYDHPAEEIPYIWRKYLAKTSRNKRFKSGLLRRAGVYGKPPDGIPLKVAVSSAEKVPLPAHFTKEFPYRKGDKKNDQESTSTSDNVLSPVIATNLFRLEQTSTGTCLVPLTMTTKTMNSINLDDASNSTETIQISDTTNTVNCTQTPISSTIPSQTPFLTIQPIAPKNDNKIVHCKCCVLLQRIRHTCHRQSYITDYFQKGVKRKKTCYCNETKFPRITNRLRLFVYMHKDPWVYGMEMLKSRLLKAEREARLDVLKKVRDRIKEPSEEDTPISWDDLLFAITFKLKLSSRLDNTASNIKKKINTLFVNFDLDTGDPAYLAESLHNMCKDEYIGLFHEFIGFLTAEQAARCGKFTDYFIQICLVDLVKRIEDEIPENERREAILRNLNKSITYGSPTACSICTAVLPTLTKYPDLALHVFSLFPHTTTKDNDRNVSNIVSVKTTTSNDQQNANKENEIQVEQQNEKQVEQQNEELVEIINNTQAKNQCKGEIAKQKKQEMQVEEQNFEQEEKQNEEQVQKRTKTKVKKQEMQVKKQNSEQVEQQNEEQVQERTKTKAKKQCKGQIKKQNPQVIKQATVRVMRLTRAQLKKQKQVHIEEQNENLMEQQSEEEMEQQSEEVIEQQNEEEMKQQNEVEIDQMNKEQVEKQGDEQVEKQGDEQVEKQGDEQVENQNEEQVAQQNVEQAENQNEEQVTQQNVEQAENQNEEQVTQQKVEQQNKEKIGHQKEEKQVKQQNEEQMEVDDENGIDIHNEIQPDTHEKEINVQNGEIGQQIEHEMSLNEELIIEQKQELMDVQNEELVEDAVHDATEAAVDYEADHSSSGEDDNDPESLHERDKKETVPMKNQSDPPASSEPIPSSPIESESPTITIIKTENQDYSENSNESMVIASDEEPMPEGPTWNRDEDKIILESLKDHLTPEERMDKTIFEILEEERVFETLSDTLSHKSLEDIKERVVYLLKMLLLSKK